MSRRGLVYTIMPDDLDLRRRRIVVAITGATGALLGIKVLLALREFHVETLVYFQVRQQEYKVLGACLTIGAIGEQRS